VRRATVIHARVNGVVATRKGLVVALGRRRRGRTGSGVDHRDDGERMRDECRRIVTHLSDFVAHTARLGELLEGLGVRSREGRKLGGAHGVADKVLVGNL
jgi:hypothetical protein